MSNQRGLQLDFLATGTWQHVFVCADAATRATNSEAREWVYKIPAAFGYVLPFDHPQRFKSEKLTTKTSYALLAQLPRGKQLLAARLRRRSVERFEAMLALVEFMCESGLSDIMLPCEIMRDCEAELRVSGATVAYRGHILKQRRAEYLFERSERLRSLDWREIVAAHHRLWRHGITFETSTAVLGLKNWALFENRLRLFDTSSLTSDPRCVSRALAPRELDRREEYTRAKQTTGVDASEPLVEFFRFMRREINRGKLEQLWRADLRG
ncbi:MAG: hypothetical protein QOF61_2943 [Acidobacteriota bacterium]|jgi:hypothetical protein|nr:hypothetical protein [Acidobacteriota bacterium]